jgi:hypothetical protein
MPTNIIDSSGKIVSSSQAVSSSMSCGSTSSAGSSAAGAGTAGKKPTSTKRSWSSDEDVKLKDLVSIHGTSKWTTVAEALGGRSGKQCRERWHNHLNPDVKKGGWTSEEDRIIIKMQSELGNQWAKITKCVPGRTDNAVKNRWHSAMRSRTRGPNGEFVYHPSNDDDDCDDGDDVDDDDDEGASATTAHSITPRGDTVIQFDFNAAENKTSLARKVSTVSESSNSSAASSYASSQSPSPSFDTGMSASFNAFAPTPSSPKVSHKKKVESSPAPAPPIPKFSANSHKAGASAALRAQREAEKLRQQQIRQQQAMNTQKENAEVMQASMQANQAKKMTDTPNSGFKPFSQVISPSVTLETGKMLPTPPQVRNDGSTYGNNMRGSEEKAGRVLTPCSHWERQQFNNSPPLLMSPANERLTPLGEPCLSDWFSSMEDGMSLGCLGTSTDKFEIISPAPLRFSIDAGMQIGNMTINSPSASTPAAKRIRSKSPWMAVPHFAGGME